MRAHSASASSNPTSVKNLVRRRTKLPTESSRAGMPAISNFSTSYGERPLGLDAPRARKLVVPYSTVVSRGPRAESVRIVTREHDLGNLPL
jgi:hypothetical protein